MTEPTTFPPPRRVEDDDKLDREVRRRLTETASWDRTGPPQKTAPYVRGEASLGPIARSVFDVHGVDPSDLGAKQDRTVGTGYDHLEDLGRMSVEAVMKQCEATVTSVEEMGQTVRTLVKRLGESLIECDADLKQVTEAANAIREKAKHTEAVIDHVNDLSKSIRLACADFQKKVAL